MKLRRMIIIAFFIALSFIGANIKIMGSIAFDSMAGFLGALLLGPVYGAAIGAIGHFLSAATSGFPLTLPVHLLIMVDMALTMYVFGILYKVLSKRSKVLAVVISSIAGVIINGPVSLFMVMPIVGPGIIAMLPILCVAALLNVIIAQFVYKLLPESIKEWKSEKLGI